MLGSMEKICQVSGDCKSTTAPVLNGHQTVSQIWLDLPWSSPITRNIDVHTCHLVKIDSTFSLGRDVHTCLRLPWIEQARTTHPLTLRAPWPEKKGKNKVCVHNMKRAVRRKTWKDTLPVKRSDISGGHFFLEWKRRNNLVKWFPIFVSHTNSWALQPWGNLKSVSPSLTPSLVYSARTRVERTSTSTHCSSPTIVFKMVAFIAGQDSMACRRTKASEADEWE